MTTFAPRLAATVALAVLLAACGNLGHAPRRYALFDLGFLQPVAPAPALVPAGLEVRSPPWLESTAMQYRLAYADATERHAYAESRWVAEPVEMLRLALDRALRPGSDAPGECGLRLGLDEFVQVFDSPAASHAELRARAELLARRGGATLARRDFVVDAPAPSADARGGVIAFRSAAQRLAGEIGGWLASEAAAGRAACARPAAD